MDDDLSVRRALRRPVQSAGYTVVTFASAGEFLESPTLAQAATWSSTSPWKECRASSSRSGLAADHPSFPIIFITALGDATTRERVRHSGVAAHLHGGHGVIEVDTRMIAAMNRDPEEAMARGEFREDLHCRLNVVEIRPPLRDRPEEVPVLSLHLPRPVQSGVPAESAARADTLALLANSPWPGNVRELENFIRRFVVLGNAQRSPQEVDAALRAGRRPDSAVTRVPAPPTADVTRGLREIARRAARDAERIALKEVLDRVRWNRIAAARILKVSYKTLLTKIVECGLNQRIARTRLMRQAEGDLLGGGRVGS